MASVFFYRTLMHPKILKRILHNDASHLQIYPAILMDYTRHKVKIAVLSCPASRKRSNTLLGRELTLPGTRVSATRRVINS
ncbi:hypothetical protein DFH94DRAFT_749334 [Russula ochroleuca]|uniref:Uncharacterized protein n=1 Tax=Russula ochroleuca TaxID=152965 RepID=A0A9P5MTK3_9AGAM|nr:hypothetical protein DFH94DRAFT_749334 [Russula ochroleuca]